MGETDVRGARCLRVDSPFTDTTIPRNAARGQVQLEGEGRWLLLNEDCLLDVETLQAFDKRYDFE